MKATLIILSVLCLSFTFASDYFGQAAGDVPGNAAAPAEPVTGAKTSSVSAVVTAALVFKASLSAAQQSTLEQAYTASLARKWSNLPCGSGCRNGIQFGALSAAQLAAAQAVIKAATGSSANDGYEEFDQNRLAEAYLHANGGGSGYDSTLRWIAFLNTPSDTGAWMLQFGGHHYAANIAFNNGHVVGATPFFQGVEPTSFTYNGKAYAPLTDDHDALTAMLASLSSSELATARLSTSYSDVTMSPGETNGGNGTFPSAKAGLPCSALTTAQKALVLAAIGHYVQDMDNATAASVMAVYTSEINSTYIAYTGSGTSGTASSFLNANTNYVRIDGPTVWIEMSCQNGVVIPGQIHYHTVWRDHIHDYGVDLSGAAIDNVPGSTAVTSVGNSRTVSVFPNPARDFINISMPERLTAATVRIVSISNGQTVVSRFNYSGAAVGIDIALLPAGIYLVSILDGSASYNARFSKL